MEKWTNEKQKIFNEILKYRPYANIENYRKYSIKQLYAILNTEKKPEINKEDKYVVYITIYYILDEIVFSGYIAEGGSFVSDLNNAIRFDSRKEANQLVREYKNMSDVCNVINYKIQKV